MKKYYLLAVLLFGMLVTNAQSFRVTFNAKDGGFIGDGSFCLKVTITNLTDKKVYPWSISFAMQTIGGVDKNIDKTSYDYSYNQTSFIHTISTKPNQDWTGLNPKGQFKDSVSFQICGSYNGSPNFPNVCNVNGELIKIVYIGIKQGMNCGGKSTYYYDPQKYKPIGEIKIGQARLSPVWGYNDREQHYDAIIPANRPTWAIAIAHSYQVLRNITGIDLISINNYYATAIKESKCGSDPDIINDPRAKYKTYFVGAAVGQGFFAFLTDAWRQNNKNFPDRFPDGQREKFVSGSRFEKSVFAKAFYDVSTIRLWQLKFCYKPEDFFAQSDDPLACSKALLIAYNKGQWQEDKWSTIFDKDRANALKKDLCDYFDGEPYDYSKSISNYCYVLENRPELMTPHKQDPGAIFTTAVNPATGDKRNEFLFYYNEKISWTSMNAYMDSIAPYYVKINFDSVKQVVKTKFNSIKGGADLSFRYELGPVIDALTMALPADDPGAMLTTLYGCCENQNGSSETSSCIGTTVHGETFGGEPNAPEYGSFPTNAVTDYHFVNDISKLAAGDYTIKKTITPTTDFVGGKGHTGDGYMMVIKGGAKNTVVYKKTVAVCSGNRYYFSTWAGNFRRKLYTTAQNSEAKPNIIIEIRRSDGSVFKTVQSGVIQPRDTISWFLYGVNFEIPVGITSLDVVILNGEAASIGNSYVIDDVEMTQCGPQLSMTINKTTVSPLTVCVGEKLLFESVLTPGAFFDPQFQWEKSTDNITWAAITGQTSPNWNIANAQLSDAVYYRIKASEKGATNICALYTQSIKVAINNGPTAKFEKNELSTCGGLVEMVINFGGKAPWKLTLNNGSKDTVYNDIAENPFKLKVKPAKSSKYTIVDIKDGGNGNACNGTTVVKDTCLVKVVGGNIAALPKDTTIIKGGTVKIRTTGTATTYTWKPATYLDDATKANPVALPVATTVYTLYADMGGCVDSSATVKINVTENDVVVDAGKDTSICAGNEYKLTAKGGTKYLWKADLSFISSDLTVADPTVKPVKTTVYYVTITANGKDQLDSVKITCNNPAVKMLQGDTILCPGQKVQLNASSEAATFEWKPATGLSDPKIANPLASPLVKTSYTVYTKTANCIDSASVIVDINENGAADVSKDTTICINGTATLQAIGGKAYLWKADATITGTDLSKAIQTVKPLKTTSYTVIITGTCKTVEKIVVVKVDTKPALAVTPKVAMICSNDTIALKAVGSGKFSWSSSVAGANDIIDSTTATPKVFPKVKTSYFLVLNNNGCIARDTVAIDVKRPQIAVEAAVVKLCKNDSVKLSATGNNTEYKWLPVTGLNKATIAAPKASPKTSTTYTVTGGTGNCAVSATVKVEVIEPATVSADREAFVCKGKTVQLLVNASLGITKYEWLPVTGLSNPNTAAPFASPLTTTTYTVKVTDANFNCTSVAYATVKVNVVDFKVEVDDVTTFDDMPVQLKAVVTGNATYKWTPSAGLNDPTSGSPIAITGKDIVYKVTATDSYGCVGTDSLTITVKEGSVFTIPNAFTPNGDYLNDEFKAVGLYQLNYFRIYNRWGLPVFTTNTIDKGWNGKHNNEDQPLDVYVWMIEGLDFKGTLIQKIGHVTLIR